MADGDDLLLLDKSRSPRPSPKPRPRPASAGTGSQQDSPILIELRSDLEALEALEEEIISDDEAAVVTNLCKTLESAMRHGLLKDSSREASGVGILDYFDVLVTMADEQETRGSRGHFQPLSVMICKSLNYVCGTKCLTSSKGRGRLLIRCGLNGQWLGSLMQSLTSWRDIDGYYKKEALLRSSSFLAMITDRLLKLRFKLDLENAAFLDSTWERPVYLKHDLVPCKDLGLMICSIRGHIIVTKVKSYSVAGEDGKVEVGDNLIAIEDTILFDISPEIIAKKIKKIGGRVPIRITVAKARSRNNKVYAPLDSILRAANLDVVRMEEKWSKQDRFRRWRAVKSLGDDADHESFLDDLLKSVDEDEDDLFTAHPVSNESNQDDAVAPKDKFMAQGGYPVIYLGSLQVGKVGDTSFLDWAIRRVMNDESKIEHKVSLHLLEFGVRMYCKTTGKQVLSYPYPKISACGCNTTDQRYMAFIGGDNLCRLAVNFLCHVFYCENPSTARDIVAHMANGFDRTLSAA